MQSDFGDLVKTHGYVKARQLLKRVAVEKHQSNISEKERQIHKSHEPQRIRESTLLSTTSGHIASYPVLEKLLLGNRALQNFEIKKDSSSALSIDLLQQIQKHDERKISKDNFLSSHEIQYSLLPHSNFNLLISNQSISHLPIELCDTMYLQLGYLQQINLTRNCLGGLLHSDLSSLSLYQFRYIKKLNLSFNNLRRLPDNIGAMECLEECNLSNNYLSTLPKSFTSLKSLLTLNLANNNFAKMFEEMNYLNCLTYLNLSNNLFMNFPHSVTKLPALKTLLFNYNAISHLAIFPPLLTIEDMWKPIVDRYNGKTIFLNILTREKVSHIECYEGRGLQYQYDLNQFQSAHYSNRKFYFRRKLWLNSCNIPEYESDIDGFSGQTFFRNNVSGETTWDIPAILDSLSSLSNLVEIHMINNALKLLPNSVLKISSLTKLVLTKNRISNLPEEIQQLTLLQYLDISTNEIKSLPNNIVYCKNLQELIVTDNHLLYLPEIIGEELKKCLFRLDVSVNRLLHLPCSLGLCEKLKYLYFHENPLINYEMLRLEYERGIKGFLWYLRNHYLIEKHQRKPPVIEYAHISINQEVNIVKDELISIIQQRLDVLKDKMLLNLQLLGIRDLPKIMFQRKYCKIISKLRLDFNPKLVLSDEFVEKLSNIELLSCKGCRLEIFPENLYLWNSLVSLNLEENKLESVPEGIIELVNLNYLNLSKNRLYAVPSGVFDLPFLQTFLLESNYIENLTVSAVTNDNSDLQRQLKVFNVSQNRLRDIPQDLLFSFQLSLISLNVEKNYLKDLPDTLCNTSLIELKVGHNQIEYLSNNLFTSNLAKSLRHFNCVENNILELPNSITLLHSSCVFEADYNPLITPPSYLLSEGLLTIQNYFHIRNYRLMLIQGLMRDEDFVLSEESLMPLAFEVLEDGTGFLIPSDLLAFDQAMNEYLNGEIFNCPASGEEIANSITKLRENRETELYLLILYTFLKVLRRIVVDDEFHDLYVPAHIFSAQRPWGRQGELCNVWVVSLQSLLRDTAENCVISQFRPSIFGLISKELPPIAFPFTVELLKDAIRLYVSPYGSIADTEQVVFPACDCIDEKRNKPKRHDTCTKPAVVIVKSIFVDEEANRREVEEDEYLERFEEIEDEIRIWLLTKEGKVLLEKEVRRRKDALSEEIGLREEMQLSQELKLKKCRDNVRALEIRKNLFEQGAAYENHGFYNINEALQAIAREEEEADKYQERSQLLRESINELNVVFNLDWKTSCVNTAFDVIQKYCVQSHADTVYKYRKEAFDNNWKRYWDGEDGDAFEEWSKSHADRLSMHGGAVKDPVLTRKKDDADSDSELEPEFDFSGSDDMNKFKLALYNRYRASRGTTIELPK